MPPFMIRSHSGSRLASSPLGICSRLIRLLLASGARRLRSSPGPFFHRVPEAFQVARQSSLPARRPARPHAPPATEQHLLAPAERLAELDPVRLHPLRRVRAQVE